MLRIDTTEIPQKLPCETTMAWQALLPKPTVDGHCKLWQDTDIIPIKGGGNTAMCGRYELVDLQTLEEWQTILRHARENAAQQGVLMDLKTVGTMFPTDIVPVITANGVRAMRWSLPLFDGMRTTINTRCEKLYSSALHSPQANGEYVRIMARHQRCLIPLAYYYEWQKQPQSARNSGRRFRFAPPDASIVYAAGIYKTEGVPVPCFSIVTTAASSSTMWCHDRMPLLLPPEAQAEWLNPNGDTDHVLQSAIQQIDYAADDDRPQQLSLFDM